MKSGKNKLKQKTGLMWILNDVRAWLLLLPLVLVFFLFVWRPTVMGAYWSFFQMKGYKPAGFIGFRNYIQVIKDTQFWPTMLNTLKYVFWSLILGYLPPLIIAIMVNEMVHFKSGFRMLIYLPKVLPAVAVMLMWYFIYYPNETGLLNSVLVSMGMKPYGWLNDPKHVIMLIVIEMTWKSFGGTMLMYFAALQGASRELYEAATLDGAGILQRVRYVTIPQIGGLLLLTFVSQIISVFQVLEQPMTMTGGGPDGASISVGYQLYKYGFVSGRVGHAMALGVIIFVILLVMTVFYFKLEKRVNDQ